MTVALLSKWGDQPAGTLFSSDAATEAAMIVNKQATATLSGAVVWDAPDGMAASAIKISQAPQDDNTLAIIGDSFAAGYLIPSNGLYSEAANCYVTYALALSGRRLRIVGNYAVSGSGVSANLGGTSMLTQIDSAIASGARHLLCMGGINDAIYDQPLQSVKNAWKTILSKAALYGIKIWLCTQPTMNSANGSYTIARQAQCMEQNNFLRRIALKNVTVIDCAAAAVDPASATGNYVANGSRDNLHPSNVGAYYMGKAVAAAWSALVPARPTLLSSVADAYSYSSASSNILDNGLFLAGTTTATNFTTAITNTGAVTPTLVSRADGFGRDQVLTGTFSAAGDGFRLISSDYKARISDGDILYAEAEIACSSITNLSGLQLQLILSHAGRDEISTSCYYDAAVDKVLPEGYTAVLRTPEFTYDAAGFGALIYLLAAVRVNGAGAGGATVKVGRMGIVKRNSYVEQLNQ